jgi:hypothetical protein
MGEQQFSSRALGGPGSGPGTDVIIDATGTLQRQRVSVPQAFEFEIVLQMRDVREERASSVVSALSAD